MSYSPPEQFIRPGEFAFGSDPAVFRTILGSCVCVTFWHPERRMGAICHFLLPDRPKVPGMEPDGRYGDEVIPLIAGRFARQGRGPEEFQVKVFGGSHMFVESLAGKVPPIGERNIQTARRILDAMGFSVLSENVGLCVHRTLVFEAGTGDVWMRQGPTKCRMECVFKPEVGCSHAR